MDGFYTAFSDDVTVGSGRWKWVRIDPKTTRGIDRSRRRLCDPQEIGRKVASHSHNSEPLALSEVMEPV